MMISRVHVSPASECAAGCKSEAGWKKSLLHALASPGVPYARKATLSAAVLMAIITNLSAHPGVRQIRILGAAAAICTGVPQLLDAVAPAMAQRRGLLRTCSCSRIVVRAAGRRAAWPVSCCAGIAEKTVGRGVLA